MTSRAPFGPTRRRVCHPRAPSSGRASTLSPLRHGPRSPAARPLRTFRHNPGEQEKLEVRGRLADWDRVICQGPGHHLQHAPVEGPVLPEGLWQAGQARRLRRHLGNTTTGRGGVGGDDPASSENNATATAGCGCVKDITRRLRT